MPIPGNRAENQAWVQLLRRFVAKAKGVHGAGPEIFYHHIGRFQELPQDVETLVMFEVQRQAALVAINTQKVCALSSIVQYGPASTRVRSNTFTPSSGFGMHRSPSHRL
jgi:hypothetical protein